MAETLTFDEVARNCTPEERNKLAFFLAQIRAKATYEALRTIKSDECPSCADYAGKCPACHRPRSFPVTAARRKAREGAP